MRHGIVRRLVFADGLTSEIEVLPRMRGPVFDEARIEVSQAALLFADAERRAREQDARRSPDL